MSCLLHWAASFVGSATLGLRVRGVWLTLLLAVGTAPVVVATPAPWSRDLALSPLLIQRMVTDKAGFRWIATDDGVYRYDGYDLVPLAAFVRRGPQLPVALVNALELDLRGRLWIGSVAGLFRFTPATGQLLAVRLPPAAAGQVGISALCCHPRTGIVWVSVGGNVLTLAPDRPRQPLFPSYRVEQAHYFEPAADGGIWLIGNQRELPLTHVSGAGKMRRLAGWRNLYPIPNSRPARFFDPTGVFEVTAAGERREIGRWASPLPPNSGRTRHLAPAFTDSTAGYVVGNHLVQLAGLRGAHPQATVSAFEPGPGLPGERDSYFLQLDAHGTWWSWSPYWRGCFKRGNFRQMVQPVVQANGQSLGSARTIGRLLDGRLFISTYGGTFAQAADSSAAPLRPHLLWEQLRPQPVELRESSYLDMLSLPGYGQTLLAGESFGISGIDGATGLLMTQFKPPYTDLRTRALLQDRQGRIWGGAESGLFQIDMAQRTLTRYGDDLPGRPLQTLVITDLAEDSANHALWITSTQGLFWLQPDRRALRRFCPDSAAARHLPTNALLAVAAAGPGRAWVGTRDQGLLLVDARTGLVRQLTVGDGLPSHTVASVLPDRRGHVWAGTYGGLARYTPTTGQVLAFREAEGLPDAELNRSAAFLDRDGSLWFGGVGGVVHLYPNEIRTSATRKPPHLRATAVGYPAGTQERLDHLLAGRAGRLNLGAGATAYVELRLALTDFFSPELTRYAYRLRDPAGRVLSSWLTTPRNLMLRGVSPGEYQVEVRAETGLGQPAANRLLVPLHVAAPWWQWPGVWALAAGLLLAIGYGTYWLRLRRILRDAQNRAELAANLHDEVGALLARVNMLAEVLRDQHLPPALGGTAGGRPDARGNFDRLLLNSRAAVQTMRDVVWGIDSRADSYGALLDRMRDHLDQTATPLDLTVDFTHSGLVDDAPIVAPLRQNLYLLFKEAVTNVVRHARHPTTLRVRFEQTSAAIVLEVTDDGQTAPGARPTLAGMGLRNMQQRAAAIGAELYTGPRADSRAGYQVRVVVGR